MAAAGDDGEVGASADSRPPGRRFPVPPLVVGAFAAFVIAGGVVFVRHERSQLRSQTQAYVGAIANLKARELTAWLDERRGDALVAGRTWVFSRAVEDRHRGQGTYSAPAMAQAEVLRSSYRYRDVFVVELDGRMVLGTDPDTASITAETAQALKAAIETGGPQLTKHWVHRHGSPPIIDVVAPLVGTGPDVARTIGGVVLRIDPRATLWPLLAEWPADRRSGRLTLLHRERDQVVFFDASRADADDHHGAHRPLSAPRLAHAVAAHASGDLGETVDENGVPVIAAARSIAGWPWTLLAMTPVAEVDAQVVPTTWLAAGWIVTFLGGAVMLARSHSRRLSQRVLKASEERLRFSQALAHAGSWDWDLRRGTLVLSDELLRLLLLPAGRPITARLLLALVPQAERRALMRALRLARAGRRPLSLEHSVRRWDGELRLMQHEARLFADARGALGRMIGVMMDVTDRRRSEQALRDSEATFKNIFDNMQDPFMTVEFGGERRVLRANPAAVRMLGFASADELVGKSMLRDIAANPEDALELRQRLLATGVARNQRSTFRRADGSQVVVEGNVRLIRDAEGGPVALEGVVRDMSAHYQRQAELIAAREAALEAALIKSRFLANMSHEIRTPLNAIVGLSHLMLGGAPPAQQRDYVTKIQGSARMLLEVINSVLDFSKIEAGKLTLESTPFYLDEVLDGVANVVAVDAQEKRLELLFSISEAVPISLVGDPLRLGQVLTNLIHNAVKFTEDGEVLVTVEVVASDSDKARLRFSVRDSGIGLTREQLSKLFAPFTQVDDSATRRFGGTGLGLAISRQLVELMGGQIEVESRPGGGSTFSSSLELGVARAGPPAAIGPDELRGLRVLVVDDHSVARMVLQRYLRDMAFSVETASSGAEALLTLRAADEARQRFDLVLLDWKMPSPDGFETAREIRRLLGNPPTIILVTAHGREEAAAQIERSGIEGLLVKPVTRSVLLDTIARVLGRIPASGRGGQAQAGAPPPAKLRAARVLVVEDNEINQQVARELLESAGVGVSIAANGREAVIAVAEAAGRAPLDAVLMDIQMPEMDGYQATREIRKDPRNAALPIIAMTAHALDFEKERCRQAGMNGHVSKPVEPAELFSVLAQWLERRAGAGGLTAIPGIDFAGALRRLRGNRELLLRLLGELVRQWRDGAQRIREQLARAEREEARRAAHTLRGAAANLGVDDLAAAAGAVERTLAGDDPDTAAVVAQLEVTLSAVCATLDRHLPAATPPASPQPV